MSVASSAADYRPICDDCGTYAAGRGMFGDPYCGFCEKSIRELRSGALLLAPVIRIDTHRVAA